MEITFASYQQEGLLSVVQFLTAQKNTVDYLSLNEAISLNKVSLKEKEGGAEVNSLYVVNLSNKPVFLMDGDILEGAKQNRVVNSSVLLAPESKIDLPVSCVEQGRWRVVSDKFKSAEYSAPSKVRSNKSRSVSEMLAEESEYFADQGRVWDDVSEYNIANNVNSNSDNLSDMYIQYKDKIEEVVKKFKSSKEANGFGIFVKNNLLSIDIFNRSDVAGEYFRKIIKGALFEVINLKQEENKLTKVEADYKTKDMLDQIEALDYNEYKSVSLGKDRRYQSEKIAASELRYRNRLIHFSALNLD